MLLVAAIVFVVGLLGLSVAVCWLFLLQSWLQASSLLLLSFVVVDCWAVLCCLLLEALSSVFLVPCFVFVLHVCLLVARYWLLASSLLSVGCAFSLAWVCPFQGQNTVKPDSR